MTRTSSASSAAVRDAEEANAPVVCCRGVAKVYGEQVVLDSIDLDVYPSETVVIMGGSGAGKSTIFRLLVGAEPPNGGSIRLFEQDICELDEDELNEVRKRFGILFQSGALFNSMTLAENVALPLREHTDLADEIIDIQVKIKLELVSLLEHADKYPEQISGGMKKRAGLARALSLDPTLLFYDEPSAGLDPVTSAEIDGLIVDLSEKLGVTSVVITHEMDSAFRIADRMAMLDKGRMLKVAPKGEFERLRDLDESEVKGLSTSDRIVRQFVRGDSKGPITDRRARTQFAEELLKSVTIAEAPSLEPTR